MTTPADLRAALANVEAALDDLAGDVALLRERVDQMLPPPAPPRQPIVAAIRDFFRTRH